MRSDDKADMLDNDWAFVPVRGPQKEHLWCEDNGVDFCLACSKTPVTCEPACPGNRIKPPCTHAPTSGTDVNAFRHKFFFTGRDGWVRKNLGWFGHAVAVICNLGTDLE